MNIFEFAFRNILRNKRRSLITISAIMIGFAAINLFGGYTHNIFEGLRESAIYGEGLGHLTIYKKFFLAEGKLNPKKYMITEEEMAKIKTLIEKNPNIKMIIPKMDVSGLISNGANSTIFIAQGVNPDDEENLTKKFPYRGLGRAINSKQPNGCQIGSDLAKMLDFKLGNVGTVLANTLDGQMNALDVDIIGIYNTGSDATNDKFIKMPLKVAQSLYNTKSVDRIILLLDDVSNTETMWKWLGEKLPGIGFEAEIKTWNELSLFYSKVRGMFNMIFLFIFSIVLLIAVTSVVNTMTMNVVERTREIGTLRALGLRKFQVLKIFGAEGFMIGFIGVCLGVALTLFCILLISVTSITYLPPGVAVPVKLQVNFVPANVSASAFFLILLSLLAAIFPSRKASKLEIVDALGHI